MWSHRRSRRPSDPEATLKNYRAEPREEFVQSLADRVSAQPRVHRTAWSRLAFAGAASTMILGMFASFGGLGYAASGATSTYSVVKKAVVQHKLSVDVHKSSASAQYATTTRNRLRRSRHRRVPARSTARPPVQSPARRRSPSRVCHCW